MHSLTAVTQGGSADTVFHFNGDLSGDVIIVRKGKEFRVPGEHILRLVAHHVRLERISKIEEASDAEILGIEED